MKLASSLIGWGLGIAIESLAKKSARGSIRYIQMTLASGVIEYGLEVDIRRERGPVQNV